MAGSGAAVDSGVIIRRAGVGRQTREYDRAHRGGNRLFVQVDDLRCRGGGVRLTGLVGLGHHAVHGPVHLGLGVCHELRFRLCHDLFVE